MPVIFPGTLAQFFGGNGGGAAAPAAAAVSSNPPSASEISRVFSSHAQHAEYTIKADDTIEDCFQHLEIVSGLIYCCGGNSGGVLQDTADTTYLSRIGKHMTDVRAVGDQNTPFLISETAKSELQPARMWVRGKAGTLIILIYRQ